MSERPLLTIGIPVYNGGVRVETALRSALAQQTDVPFDIYVSNNGSTDDTGDVLRQFDDPRLQVEHFGTTVNMWENHNRCLNGARGRYVLFCHADDALLPNAVELLARRMQERHLPDAWMAFGHSLFRDPLRRWTTCGFSVDTPVAGERAPLPHTLGGICPSGALYSRDAFVGLGGFYPCTVPGALSDMATGIRLALEGFTFEMVAGLWFRREAAATHAGLTPEKIQARTFDALDALEADYGMERLVRVALQGIDLPVHNLTLLESWLVAREAFSARELQSLLRNRMSASLVRSGEARAITTALWHATRGRGRS